MRSVKATHSLYKDACIILIEKTKEVNNMIPLYIGAKVKLDHPEILCGDAKIFYQLNNCVYVRDIHDNNKILVGSLYGSSVTINQACVVDVIPEEHILSVLKRKESELDKAQKEVQRIKEYINWKCSIGGNV